MQKFIFMLAAINIYGFLWARSYYKKHKGKGDISLEALCPNCKVELDEESLICLNCGLNMNNIESESYKSCITCPNCAKTFGRSQDYCPHCREYTKYGPG